MPRQSKQIRNGGNVLVEAMLGSIIFALLVFFAIDLALTTFTLHRIHRFSKKFARTTSISSGKSVREVKRAFQAMIFSALAKQRRAGRVRSIEISLSQESGNRLTDRETIASGSILTLCIDAVLSMNFVPIRLFEPIASHTGFRKIALSSDGFHYRPKVTFIVE